MGRTSGRLPLPRLIADGRVAVIGVPDLAFDSGETAAVMRAAKLDLPTAEIERISAQLEGWPAGVYLTARSMKREADLAADPRSARCVSSRRSSMGPSITQLASEYLRTELLERLAPDDLAFALRTSVLERLSGPLCDALLGLGNSAARLGPGRHRTCSSSRSTATTRGIAITTSCMACSPPSWRAESPRPCQTCIVRAAAWHLEQGTR